MNEVRLSRRSTRIAPFHVMELLQRAQALEEAGRDVIHLEVGEPDFPCPEPIMRAASAALAAGRTRYTGAAGLPALQRRIADWYGTRFGVDLDPERVIVTPGASGALQLALAALVDPGDGVLITDPGYPCNRHFLALVDGEPQAMVVPPHELDGDCIRRHWRGNTVAALLASPDNPTGTVLAPSRLAGIADAVRERSGALVMDEIYQGLVYDDTPHTILAHAPDALVVNSFSKYFGMTGWRLGWLLAPEAAVEPLTRLAQNVFLAAPTPAQYAALAAFTPECREILEARRAELGRRRDALLAGLARLGLAPSLPPQGAFYLWLDISRYSDDSQTFCQRLLEEENVAITPGIDFALVGGERHVRIAFTTGVARLEEAVARLERFLARR